MVLVCCFLATSPLTTWSQGIHSSTVRVTITSNVSQARVFIDSVEVGTTPLVGYVVAPGKHSVCVMSSSDREWITNSVCEEIDVEENTERQVKMWLPRQILITSEPYGARVMYGDSVLGETPYVLFASADVGSIQLSMEEYDDVTMVFDVSTTALHGVLNPQRSLRGDNTWLYLEKEESKTAVPIVVTASTAVVTGIVAAYWKLRADNLYGDYRTTGDSAQLDQIRQLDVASGIALGVSQVSLALLTYFLLSR